MSSLSASSIKYYVNSNLTALYGSILTPEIDSIENAGTDLKIRGKFTISFGDTYTFTMTIDGVGKMKTFNRELIKNNHRVL